MILVLTIIIATLIQIHVGPWVDLLLLTTLSYGFLYGWRRGCGVGLVCGLIQDVFSVGLLGLGPVGLVICGALAGFVRHRLSLGYWIVRVSLVFIMTILNLLIYFFLARIFSQDRLYIQNWLSIGIGNTVVAGIVFWLVDRYG